MGAITGTTLNLDFTGTDDLIGLEFVWQIRINQSMEQTYRYFKAYLAPATACTAKTFPKVYGNLQADNPHELIFTDFDVNEWGSAMVGQAVAGTTIFGSVDSITVPWVMKLDKDGNVRWAHKQSTLVFDMGDAKLDCALSTHSLYVVLKNNSGISSGGNTAVVQMGLADGTVHRQVRNMVNTSRLLIDGILVMEDPQGFKPSTGQLWIYGLINPPASFTGSMNQVGFVHRLDHELNVLRTHYYG